MGVTVSPTAILVHNMAAVMVTATLPPFAQPGTKIDITAGAIGDSSNLQGGLLLLTPLKGADGQGLRRGARLGPHGRVCIRARVGNSTTVNHPTVGRIPDGAIVEKSPPSIAPTTTLRLQLNQADFTTAARIAEAVNSHFAADGEKIAHAESAGAIAVEMPKPYANRSVEFVAELEALTVESDRRQKVVINEKTGTIVLGKEITITPVAIVHGSLSVEIRTQVEVSQPAPLAQGTTAVVPQTTVATKEEKAKSLVLKKGATVEDLVKALQSIGSAPRDIIAILETMRTAGALDADIEVI